MASSVLYRSLPRTVSLLSRPIALSKAHATSPSVHRAFSSSSSLNMQVKKVLCVLYDGHQAAKDEPRLYGTVSTGFELAASGHV
jgi:hypothetical protein